MKKRSGSNIYNRWRPRRFDEFVGNKYVVRAIQGLLQREEPPQSWLFHGPSGTGKTTMARIIGAYFACTAENDRPCGECAACEQVYNGAWPDYAEINCADQRGIDPMRGLLQRMRFAPLGRAKVYTLDEVQQTTRDAANALLKSFEDGTGLSYIVLCTTEPQDLLDTLRTRADSFKFTRWSREEIAAVAAEVFPQEGLKVDTAAAHRFADLVLDLEIVSPRQIMGAIDVVIPARSFKVLSSLDSSSPEITAISKGVFNGDWRAVSKAWSPEFDAEEVRMAVCGYLRKVLIKETDLLRGVCIAEALKELAVRVPDNKQENNVLARLFLATARMSTMER